MTAPRHTVLVAERAPQHADLHASWLSASDRLRVRTAYSAQEAGRALTDEVDVVVADRPVAEAVDGADSRLVVLTGPPAEPGEEPGDPRFDAVVAKPVTSAELGRTVVRLCGGVDVSPGEWFAAPRSASSS